MEYLVVNGELYHHGIKGQKWGVRRWQNADGTFNEAGKKRYFNSDGTLNKKGQKMVSKQEYKAKKKDINRRRQEINAKYDKKNTETVFGLDSGGVGSRVKGHIKNEYERSKALNKLDQEQLNAKREYRKKIGKKKTDTILMKMGQNSINSISEQSISEFTRDYVKTVASQAYNKLTAHN